MEDLAAGGYRVGFTHFSSAAPNLVGGSAASFEVDLATGAGLPECLGALGPLVAVVNCASLPVPSLDDRRSLTHGQQITDSCSCGQVLPFHRWQSANETLLRHGALRSCRGVDTGCGVARKSQQQQL